MPITVYQMNVNYMPNVLQYKIEKILKNISMKDYMKQFKCTTKHNEAQRKARMYLVDN